MKKVVFFLVLASLLFTTFRAQAQINQNCVSLTTNLHIGSTDATTGGQVSQLQKFLISKGYLVLPAGFSTGYFGSLTTRAVSTFQVANGINPPAGFVGPLTRAKIAELSCIPVTPLSPTPTVAPHINSLSPSRGVVGTRVTIHGSGFAHTGNEVSFKLESREEIRRNLNSTDGATLQFIVPEQFNPCNSRNPNPNCNAMDSYMGVYPGNYSVSVSNSDGASNSVNFRVTDNQTTSSPHIDSVSPTSGPVGTRVIIRGSGFATQDNLIYLLARNGESGDGYGSHIPLYNSDTQNSLFDSDGQTIVIPNLGYIPPYGCSPPGAPCRAPEQPPPSDTYKIVVYISANNQSNSVFFTVTSN